MKAVVIGAGGFVGQRLSAHLARDPSLDRLVLVDQVPPVIPASSGPVIEAVSGDFADPDLVRTHIAGADQVYHLASILGGAAEADYPLARRVNIDATLSLIEALRDANPGTRLVFASTIAVFSKPFGTRVTDQSPTAPVMVYGAQKLMMETAITNFAARGWLDGLSLRLAGVTARDGVDGRLKSAFMSRVFHAVKRGEDITLPVHPHSTTWLTSVETAARNFAHAGKLPAGAIGRDRAFTLPACHLTFEDLATALYRHWPDSKARIRYEPDEALADLFGTYPPLETAIADRLGFANDADAAALVAHSY